MNRVFFFVSIFTVIFSTSSWACSCNGPLRPSFHEDAKEVFVGTVLSKSGQEFADQEFTFSVSEIVRGDLPQSLSLNSAFLTASCGRNYQIGHEYIVVVRKEHGKLYSGLCSSWSMSSELGKTVYEFLTILNEVAEPLTRTKSTPAAGRAENARPFAWR